ncbi:MAG TPA: DUF1697 domain-containing protein [Anaerolineales bacterium]|nr:DUF1697 domain-containing protein [Anaerolineales bacterium]
MKYVAFLRAINVGGNAIIKMADLKKMFEAAGLENVQTYIQSGNVIFESEEGADSLAKQIERLLEKTARYKIEVFVRTMREVQSIAEKSPFGVKDGEMVYVTFLNTKPGKQSQQALLNHKSDADDFAFKGREVYSLRRDREKSVFSNNFLEKILKMPATSRNLTTITKIVEKYK